jgi:hypothetical protein
MKRLLRELLAAHRTVKFPFRCDPSCVSFEEKETLSVFLLKKFIFGTTQTDKNVVNSVLFVHFSAYLIFYNQVVPNIVHIKVKICLNYTNIGWWPITYAEK